MLKGKRIWLVGASDGIGKSLAIALSEEGAKLILSARNTDKLRELKKQLKGKEHQILSLDVSDSKAVVRAAKKLTDLDMLIFMAGIYKPMSYTELDLDFALSTLDINLNGALRVVGAILPKFIKKNQGHIVLAGSVAGYAGLPKSSAYGISKAAIQHMAETLKLDLSKTNIKVQLISPGFVKTRLTNKNKFNMPLRISPEEAAKEIVYGLKNENFEIHFPKKFTYLMKILSHLPYWLYFKILSRI